MKGGQGKRDRQEAAIKRTEASLLKWEEEFKNPKVDDDFKRLIKKKIERAQTTVKNTKEPRITIATNLKVLSQEEK